MIPKFRAWLKSIGEMVEVLEIDFYNKEVAYIWTEQVSDYELEQTREVDKIDDVILMQGWKPEYQPELTIYKGDIINVHWFYANHDPETLGVYEDETNLECVEIIEVRGVLGFYFEDDFLPLAFVPTHEESFEIIGNIYENPELLKEQNGNEKDN